MTPKRNRHHKPRRPGVKSTLERRGRARPSSSIKTGFGEQDKLAAKADRVASQQVASQLILVRIDRTDRVAMAGALGISYSHVSKIFNGIRLPGWILAREMATYLKCSLDELDIFLKEVER